MNTKTKEILDILAKIYPDAKPQLKFNNNFELLISVILSAQCTDKRVNEVTKKLFLECNTPEGFLELGQTELEKRIYSCGFYRAKAQHIISCCRDLIEKYGGEVPNDFEKLQTLSGVGRKTANVVLSVGFGEQAIAVDTHVFRVSNRLGLAEADNVLETEIQLRKNIDRELWSKAHHYLIYLGRGHCSARKPECAVCELNKICKHYSDGKGETNV